jgi:Cdc6-like AAA superfamily ATPase
VEIRNAQNLQLDAQKLHRHETILQWLSPTQFSAQQHDIVTQKQEGTGQWFLESLEFKKWLQGSHKTLFCPGIPGAGKTMLAGIAVDHLRNTAQSNDIGVSFLYCNYKTQVDQSASNLLCALLKQLLISRPDIAAPVIQMYDNHSKLASRPSVDEICNILLSICSNYSAVYIIVDALDECSDEQGARSLLIEKLLELQSRVDVRLLCTSRFIPEVTNHFESKLQLEVRASSEDVRRFLVGQVSRLPTCIKRDEELQAVITDKIGKAADGMQVVLLSYMYSNPN